MWAIKIHFDKLKNNEKQMHRNAFKKKMLVFYYIFLCLCVTYFDARNDKYRHYKPVFITNKKIIIYV